jgi:hypothetical protein
LWDLKERSRQRRRTENYREIMHMQQKIAEPLAKLDHEDETAAARENQVLLLKQIFLLDLDLYLEFHILKIQKNIFCYVVMQDSC